MKNCSITYAAIESERYICVSDKRIERNRRLDVHVKCVLVTDFYIILDKVLLLSSEALFNVTCHFAGW